jgi:hypothetical protein
MIFTPKKGYFDGGMDETIWRERRNEVGAMNE